MKKHAICIVLTLFVATKVRADNTSSRLHEIANDHVVMIEGSGKCHLHGAGLTVGLDEGSAYVATANHVVPEGCDFHIVYRDSSSVTKSASALVHKRDADMDLAVLRVERSAYATAASLPFTILAPTDLPPLDVPVHTIGATEWSQWGLGGDSEKSLPPDGDTLQIRTAAAEGQSGGGIFSESWELLGIVQTQSGSTVRGTRWTAVAKQLRNWKVPYRLKQRPIAERSVGAEELARRGQADLFAARAGDAASVGNRLAALTYLSEARSHRVMTPMLRAQSLLLPRPVLQRSFALDTDDFAAVLLLPQRGLLIVGGATGGIDAYRASDGTLLQRIAELNGRPSVMRADASETRLLVGTQRTGLQANSPEPLAVFVLDLSAGTDKASPLPRAIPLINVINGKVLDVSFAGGSRALVLSDRGLHLLDLAAGIELVSARSEVSNVGTLSAVAPGRWLALGSAAFGIDITLSGTKAAPQFVPRCATPLYPNAGTSVPAGGGRIAIACGAEVTLSTPDGKVSGALSGHTEPVTFVGSFDGGLHLVTGSSDGTARIWDPEDGSQLAVTGVHSGPVEAVSGSPSGDRTGVLYRRLDDRGVASGAIAVWTHDPSNVIPRPPPAAIPLVVQAGLRAAMYPGPPVMSFAARTAQSRCWDSTTRRFVHLAIMNGQPVTVGLAEQPPDPSREVVVTPDCLGMAVAAAQEVHMFARPTLSDPWSKTISSTTPNVARVAIAADRSRLAWVDAPPVVSPDGAPALDVRTLDSSGITRDLERSFGQLFSIALSRRGSRLATYSLEDGSVPIRIWDTQSGRKLSEVSHPTGLPAQLVFDPRSKDTLFVLARDAILRWRSDGTHTSIRIRGARHLDSISLTSDGGLAIVAGTPWLGPAGIAATVWAIDLVAGAELVHLSIPGTATTVLSNDDRHLLLDYGHALEERGSNENAEQARRITGQEYAAGRGIVGIR
jgi:WD40 repeat protein